MQSATNSADSPAKTLSASASPSGRLRILFTEGASLSARHTLYGLGPLHDVDVMDPDPLCQCRFSSFTRRWIRSPSFSKEPENFLRVLAGLVREGQYDVVLPTHEQVYLLSRFRDALTPHVGLALPEFAALERLQNKADFSRLLDELNLPQPQTTVIRTRGELDRQWQYPFFLKLAHSTAGGGVFRIDNRATLEARANEIERKGLFNGQSETLVQQPGRGVQSTVFAILNGGQLVGVHVIEARSVGVGGMSDARVSADHPQVREHVTQLGRHLNWHGSMFLDYFYDRETGRPEYIEANPRIGETVNALLSDINLPELLVRVSRGETPLPAPFGRVGVRSQSFMMILMKKGYDGHSRGDLLREIRDYRAGRGLYEHSEDELTRPHVDPLSRLPRIWIATQLLAWPKIARRIVHKTVENYSLPESRTDAIKRLPLDLLDCAFSG